MIGAIIGDIAGSRFERENIKTKAFDLMPKGKCRPTDDTMMTLAICDALLRCRENVDELGGQAVRSMQAFGLCYPDAGYGGRFVTWLMNPRPYNSLGNGAAMRVSG